jgi:lysophospholipase L1-like esterase
MTGIYRPAPQRRLLPFLLLLATGLLSGTLSAAPYQQDTATGQVVFEAEHADANIARGGYSWEVDTTSGYSGDSALRALPGSGGAQKNPGYSLTSPELDYQVNFTRTGTHYVWVRGLGSASSNNSVHVGLDGAEIASSEALNFPVTGSWVWHGGAGVASFQVASTGVHTVNVWMRESGFRIDKLVVTTESAFAPAGIGPAESPYSGSGGGSGGGGSLLFADDFGDGNLAGWTIADECVKGTSNWTVISTVLMQTGDCRGFSSDGVAVGTQVISADTFPADVDIRLRVNSRDPATDGAPGNNASIWKYHNIGVLFGYQNANNHYRLELDGMQGHRKLWRKKSGVYTQLNASPQSFNRGQWHDLRIVRRGAAILVFVDGLQVLAARDAEFGGGPIGLFCARNSSCNFDDISVLSASTDPMVGVSVTATGGAAFSEYFVDTDNALDASAFATSASGIGGVEFVLDEGTGGEQAVTDLVGPYTARFTGLASGDHALTAHLLDGSANRLVSADATATLPQLGVQGIHLHAVGDSICNGLHDDISADDKSADGRNTGGGYTPVLNNLLSQNNAAPVTVLNDGNPGEESSEAAARFGAILARSPEAQAYLVFYGANDSGGSMPRPPGLDLGPGDSGYAGSFKYYMQQIIDAVTGQGKQIILAKAPPYLANATRNNLIIQYNQVIDQLVLENGLAYVPVDLYSYFFNNTSEMSSDGIHPTGAGYQSMARLWCQRLNGQMGLSCIP